MGHFSGYFEGASTFLTPKFRGQKSLSPLEISLEMAHYVVCPQKKIISRIFKISGALIVKADHLVRERLEKYRMSRRFEMVTFETI
jgi:hypothetical protein